MPRRMLNFLATLVVAYAVVLLILRVFENSFIFYPNIPGRLTGDWQPQGLPVEDAWLRTSDGVKLHAWWIAAPNAEFTFVAFHGNAANIANRADTYQFLRSLPVNVLAVEYRGYGKSEGVPNEAGIYIDADAAYDYLVRERKVPPARIISYGQSLGTAVATDLAARREVGGLVLEAAFASSRAVARRAMPVFPGLGLVLRSKLATGEKLSKVSAPVLVAHCVNDPVIPFVLGEEVFRLAREPKTFFRVDGYCHEESSLVAPEPYRAQLLAFLSQIKSAGTPSH